MSGQRIVTNTGISPAMHTVHLVLTCCSFGMWSPIWFLHWLLTRRRSVTSGPVPVVQVNQWQQQHPQQTYPPQGYPQQWQQPRQYPQQPPQ